MDRSIHFVLASGSSQRLALLQQIGIAPDVVEAPSIEETPYPKELPSAFALRIAREKAITALEKYPQSLILAADTVPCCGRRIIQKASSVEDARRTLELLSGRRHRVYTAVCVLSPFPLRFHTKIVTTHVHFKVLSSQEIEKYLLSLEWQDKAGYAIQGYAESFIKKISGSYSNVVGLPLLETRLLLESMGLRNHLCQPSTSFL
jgi:septum formation protein